MPTKSSIPTVLRDKRVNCYSIMTVMTVTQYLSMVSHAYPNRGAIDGQREQLRTTSAIRIRRRMIDDVIRGAVLPPMVVGVVLEEAAFGDLEKHTPPQLSNWVKSLPPTACSIIDGMQRTTALYEAVQKKPAVGQRTIRIEIWASINTNSLMYRMLVLNTGQVPWNLRRQVEIVFRSLIAEIKSSVPDLEVLDIDKSRRRSHGGQIAADDLVELYLAFGVRKEKVDMRERIADEFTRLDFIEAASDDRFADLFFRTLRVLGKLDKAFDVYKVNDTTLGGRIKNGKDLFSSLPACVGFVTAVALEVQGRPGVSKPITEQTKILRRIEQDANDLLKTLKNTSSANVGAFLDLETLNELLQHPKGGLSVGDFEREFFLKSFQVLVAEKFALTAMTACWRAY